MMPDYNIGEKVAVLRLIHHERFKAPWVEYHHPRLTRVYFTAIRDVCIEGRRPSPYDLEDTLFSWMG